MITIDSILPEKIIHIADVHIRNLKRYDEYQKVFDILYDDLDRIKEKHTIGTMIVGDLVHDKLVITNELQIFARDFIKELCKRGPVYIVKGNHDYNEINPSRLNSIEPIINGLDNIHFLDKNDLFRVGNSDVVFNVWAIDHKFNTYKKEELKDYRQVILYHGPVNGLTNDDGYEFIDKNYLSIEDFLHAKPAAVMLGDIHKRNVLNVNPNIVMVGSTIQQHIRERVKNHGYCVWDTKEWSYEFKDIYNEYRHIILSIENGILLKEDKLRKDCKIHTRVDITNTPNHIKDIIISNLKQEYNIVSLIENKKNILNDIDTDIDINNLDKDTQIDIIRRYMSNYDEDSIENVIDKFKEITKKLKISNFTSSNIKLLTLEFSNMFIFGNNINIKFSDFNKNIVSIQGDNGSGKSSIFTALSYALFADSDKTYKPIDVLSGGKEKYNSKVTFLVNDNVFSITRTGTKGYKDMVKEHVDFFNETTQTSLNGVDRRETNRIIKSYIGDYELFDLTTLSTQSSNSKFINKSSKNRREILSKILGFDMFEPIENQASVLHKKYKNLYQTYYDKILDVDIEKVEKDIKDFGTIIKDLENDKISYKEEETIIRSKRDILLTSIKKIKIYPENYNTIINQKITKSNTIIKSLNDKLKISRESIDTLTNDKNILINKYPEYDLIYNTIYKLSEDINKLDNDLKIQKRKVNNIKKNYNNLLKAYDPDCKCNNSKTILEDIKEIEDKHNKEVKIGKALSDKYNKYVDKYNLNNSILKDDVIIKNIEKDIEFIDHSIEKTNLKIEKEKVLLININNDLQLYNDNIDNIKSDINTKKVLLLLDEKLKNKNILINNINTNLINSKVIAKNNIDKQIDYHSNVKKIKEYSLLLKTYSDLKKVVSKDGIGLYLLKDKIKLLNKGINDLIGNITSEFTINIKVDENVEIIKVDKRGIKSSMTLASESQKFLTSLALRVILSEHGYIPRFNIIMIDEGFSSLDNKSRYKVEDFTRELLKYYNTLLLVSHDIELSNIADYNIKVKNKTLGSVIKISH